MTSGFRFELGDFQTQQTVSIVPPVVSVELAGDEVGAFREPGRSMVQLSVSNMTMTRTRDRDDGQYFQWLQEFLIDGNVGQGDELQSSVTLLGPDMQEELLTIYFDQVGLVSIDPHLSTMDSSLAQMQVELYVERVRLEGNWR